MSPGNRRPRPRLAASVALALLAALVVPTAATAASAPADTIGDVNLLFSAPGTPARYGRGEVVRIEAGNINFVQGCTKGPLGHFIKDWFQPTADLYVVGGGTPMTGGKLVDTAGAPNTVFGGLAGQFFDVILTTTDRAGSGTYDVVVDECQNGMFDEGQDTVIRDAFTVDLDLDVPGFDTDLASFDRMKVHARSQAATALDLKKMFVYADISEVAKKTASASIAIVGGVTGMLGFAVGEFTASLDPRPQLLRRLRTQVTDSLNVRIVAATHLAADPPDHVFQTLSGPERDLGAIPPGVQTELAEVTAVAATAVDQLRAVEGAILTALERYQGAEQAGNAEWALRHARALQELVDLHGVLAVDAAAAIVAVHDAYAVGGHGLDGAATFEISNPLNQVLDDFNHTDPLIHPHFWNSGADIDETRAALENWREVIGTPTSPDRLFEHLDAAVDAAATLADWNDALGVWADEATADVLPGILALLPDGDLDPTAVIAPVPAAPAGGTITLDATGSTASAGTTITDWMWDLDGDGEYDDAFGATPSWTIPGYAQAGAPWVIGLQVVSDAGLDATHTAVTVTAGNRAPVVALADPGLREVPDGAATTLTIDDIVDPDGDATTIAWYVDQELQPETGMSLTLPSPTYGVTLVEVIVTDAPGAITRDGWVVAFLPDTSGPRDEWDHDRDGYYAAPGPDCDDDNRLVNPARPEVAGNGVDDDCNPATSDDPDAERGGPGFPSPRNFRGMEGDVHRFTLSNWSDPQRMLGGQYTITVDWGDGSTSERTVAADHDAANGSDHSDTTFDVSHRYTTELDDAPLSYCIHTGADQLVSCYRGLEAITVGNMRPFVNPADLATWPEDDESLDGNNTIICHASGSTCRTPGSWIPRDPSGRSVFTADNPSPFTVRHAPVALAEAGYGRGMVELAVEWGGGSMDDDDIGFVVGYDSGEIYDHAAAPDFTPTGTADFVSLIWSGHSIAAPGNFLNPNNCNDGHYTPAADYTRTVTALSRTHGQPLRQEHGLGTFDFPYDPSDDDSDDGGLAQNPGCDDAFGDEVLAEVDLSGSENTRASGAWMPRTVGSSEAGAFGLPGDTYLFTFDYRPDRIQMWLDGEPIADVTAPAGDPFPPGALGFFYRSQSNVRASASAPEPGFTFPQGTPGLVTMPLHDPGTDDELTVLFDWRDGEPQTTAEVVANPAGQGWFDASAEHVYTRAGDYRGQVCAYDEDAGSCFPFRVSVTNLPPVVDAGPDIVTGAALVLEHPQFKDPGIHDTHTATVDWGDGATTAGTVEEVQGAGLVGGTHTYTADGTHTVEVCVEDQHGATGCDEFLAEVRASNRTPEALLAAADGTAGVPVEIGVGFTDDNPDDTHTATFDTGESAGVTTGLLGVAAPSLLDVELVDLGLFGQGTVTHTWSEPGTYSVRACVRDQDGAQDCATDTVTIAAADEDRAPDDDDGGADDGGADDGGADDGGADDRTAAGGETGTEDLLSADEGAEGDLAAPDGDIADEVADDALAGTGAQVRSVLWFAVLLTLIGFAMVTADRRRRSA